MSGAGLGNGPGFAEASASNTPSGWGAARGVSGPWQKAGHFWLQRAQEKMLSPADASVLKRYQRRRRGANLTMTATMELFKQLFAQQALPVRWLRNTGMRGIDALPLLKKQIMRHAMGLSS